MKLGEKLAGARELLKDGNIKLKKSISKNDKHGINVVQLMIETATREIAKYQNRLSSVKEQKSVVKRTGKPLDETFRRSLVKMRRDRHHQNRPENKCFGTDPTLYFHIAGLTFLSMQMKFWFVVCLNTVKSHFKALGLYNFKRGFGRAYKRGEGGGAYIRVGL